MPVPSLCTGGDILYICIDSKQLFGMQLWIMLKNTDTTHRTEGLGRGIK